MTKETLARNFTVITDEYRSFVCEKSLCDCCEIHDHYKQTAQSEGNAKDPTFVFVGEAYGRDEAEQVRPFIGRAGQRLREELRKHDSFTRETSILTNILSCRPPNNKFPQCTKSVDYKTFPDGREYSRCERVQDVAAFCMSKWFSREMEILQPKVIVTLGAVPLRYILGKDKIGDNRGEWQFSDYCRAWVLPTYHPSYVLRCMNDTQKAYVENLFEQDIAKVAKTWRTVVDNDSRMSMGIDEWRRRSALNVSKDKFAEAGLLL